jgi:hypothetical protein
MQCTNTLVTLKLLAPCVVMRVEYQRVGYISNAPTLGDKTCADHYIFPEVDFEREASNCLQGGTPVCAEGVR